ncbi:unnamed protein product [marine sediment metagenome]|uniref:Tryptophan synthase beta chain-like PALP domain-containing protein n=1 Tax=marine sediment metagenome TaxID=412755 RepID=X1INN8_9ZZZZ
MKQGVLSRYRDFLPVTPATPLITLGEGDTPLVRSRVLEKELGCGELYFKLEGCNPTGSFKDRDMVVAGLTLVQEHYLRRDKYFRLSPAHQPQQRWKL